MNATAVSSRLKKKFVPKATLLNLVVPEGHSIDALPPRERSHVERELSLITDEQIDRAIDKLPS